MRIKKFTCINCGAPKVNEYKSPYIMCDYCGSFTDIDFTLGMNFWNQSPLTNIGYAFNKMQMASRMQSAMRSGDKAGYYKLQREYWDYYYRTYPPYLPPSIDTPEKYAMYLDVCADSSTNYAFSPTNNDAQVKLAQLQQAVSYDYTGSSPKANPVPFFNMAEYFIGITKDGFKDFYSNPKYEIMNELLPQSVHLKMKVSMFVQAWLPYLTDADADRFLKLSGFTMEYVELDTPPGHKGECEHCKAEIYIPEGSYRVYCEACRKTTMVQRTIKCLSCGAENDVPDNPSKPIECAFCGVENRLIKGMFG
jgi:DNA-directed RNA polymerase subunit RPC12/RpoP